MKTNLRLACLLFVITPLTAGKLSDEFRTAFEKTFKPGKTYAVVMQDKIPTTSVYGIDGEQINAHFSIDIIDGRWEVSKGFLDTDQVAADQLSKNEIVELESISYKDNRADLRVVSVTAHKITRGEWIFSSEKREPVATNFKFFFPFDDSKELGPKDVPKVIEYISAYLKPFPSESAAQAFARNPSPPPAPARKTTSREVKVGMTPLEVIEILGKPKEELVFGNTTRWTYPDLVVIFENGKLKEVKF